MDAAVSLHHGAPLPSFPPPPPHHHRALHLRHPPPSSISARLTATAAPRPRAPARSSSSSAAPASLPAQFSSRSSSTRAATGYAAALADASIRAGTLLGASRHARALLLQAPRGRGRGRHDPEEEVFDARVGALVRMLVRKGKAGLVAEVMAEFAAICDHLLVLRPSSSSGPARARAY
ncbi:uncharacterized protein LOC100837131 [Brachypodium distachyon]|uniref:Uncharacterized protein n=1 Tax=Brachypodium distachyon TaxID=15368 RepID=I1GX07_BRADI|nr:uncharacterized protein LOC100837131 [Brachypodium distachyon]KQK17535.1 hypothetical protein BRADI_1g35130v3 [Brachypodium distachyon]|eukprot:XP_003560550.1 uncharacterized protein LOC100837131 [Brachypodium distachyon]